MNTLARHRADSGNGSDPLMSKRGWTTGDLEHLEAMRDIHEMKWDFIGKHFGVTGSACCTRYHDYKARKEIKRKRAENPVAPPPMIAPAIDPAPANGKRPRYFHNADAEMRMRIERQGLTAGIFGDPPAGRSALDRRQAGK